MLVDTAVSGPSNPRKIVLVIDDEVKVREAIGDILDLQEIAILAAATGAEGVELFNTNREQIGLTILDYSMPGMGGMETFEAIRAIDPAAKILISSGFTEGDILQRMAGNRPTGFLQKPYRLETVLQTVAKFL